MTKEMSGEVPSDGGKLWSSRYVFLMAAIGSAVGLANLWKFPYTAGENGGGAFMAVYILAVAFISIPIFMAELMIGKKGRHPSPEISLALVSEAAGRSSGWRHITLLGVLSAFLTMSFYYVIAGWAIFYAIQSIGGVFSGAEAGLVREVFGNLAASPGTMILYQTVFALMVLFSLVVGFQAGIERIAKFLMPVFFVLFALTLIVSLVFGDVARAFHYLFDFKLSALTPRVLIYAVGQAFFSVGVGACVLMVFGSKLPLRTSVTQSAVIVAGADTLVAILAGLAIFPIVFSSGLSPAEGPGLLFVSIPLVFGNLPFGALFSFLFFIMVVLAALSSTVAIALPPAEWLCARFRVSFKKAVVISIGLEWLFGLLTVFSFGPLEKFYPLDGVPLFSGLNPFQIIEMLTSNVTLPIGGLLLSIYVGWILPGHIVDQEMAIGNPLVRKIAAFCFRYLIPLALICLIILGLSGE